MLRCFKQRIRGYQPRAIYKDKYSGDLISELVLYSDHGDLFSPCMVIQMSSTMVPGIWIANHLNNEQVNVCYSDVYAIEMFTIQILTVALISCQNIGLNTEHGYTEHFEVQISYSCFGMVGQSHSYGPDHSNPNYWQSEQNGHWKTEKNLFSMSAPTTSIFLFFEQVIKNRLFNQVATADSRRIEELPVIQNK